MKNGIVWIKGYTKEDLAKKYRNTVSHRMLTKVEKDKAEKHLHLLKKIVSDKETEENK